MSQVSSAANEGNTLILPSHQAGDTLVMFAYRSSSGVIPTLPAGWVPFQRRAAGSNSFVGASKIASSSGEISGTWTNAEILACSVYRDSANLIFVGGANNGGTTGTTGTYPILAAYSTSATGASIIRQQSGDAWVIGAIGLQSNSTNGDLPPTGMTNRISLAGVGAREIAIHDTNANVSSWAATSITISASVMHSIITAELFDSGCPKSSSSGRPFHPFIQQVIR